LISLAIVPIVNSSETNNIGLGYRDLFTSCYIEAEGEIAKIDWPAIIKMPNMWKTFWFRPFNDNRALVSYWSIVLDCDSDVKIYDEENGNILWDHQGSEYPQLKIFGYSGIYIPKSIDNSLHVSLSGNALVVLTIMR
jgi:hypothetical protein